MCGGKRREGLSDRQIGASLVQTLGIPSLEFTALKADVQSLHELFINLEKLTTPEAKSSPGMEILIPLVTTCQHVHDRRIMHHLLAGSFRLGNDSIASIARTITKLSRYFAVSRFLLQAARKYPFLGILRFSAVNFKASNLPATELDSMTAYVTHSFLTGPKLGKLTSGSMGHHRL